MSYLLDTNVISELLRPSPNEKVISWFSHIVEESLYISVLTVGEIRKGVEKLPESRRKEEIRIWLENDLQIRFEGRILIIDQHIANRWGRLLNEINKPMPAIDSLIAATAIHHDLRLVTRNVNDFRYPTLQVLNPWE